MQSLTGKKVVVLGAGASGRSAAKLALQQGADVALLDGLDGEALSRAVAPLMAQGIRVGLGWKPSDGGESSFDLAVCSPGFPLDSPMVRMLQERGVDIVSELEFGSWMCPWPRLAVTGTNGKTTVVEMLTHCLERVGKRVVAGGNIGLPLSEIALQKPVLDVLVVEVSSYQLETTHGFACKSAALLNVTPDHLSRHGSMAVYQGLKLELLRQVEPGGTCVLRRDLADEAEVMQALDGHRVVTFSGISAEADFFVQGSWLCRRNGDAVRRLLDCSRLPYSGVHNYENCLAVLALCEAYGVKPEAAAEHLVSFHVGPHRMECVGESGGVRYINDSKATNLDALVQSVRQFDRKRGDIALIAGGVVKGCDLGEALPELVGRVRKALLIGECREDLARRWGTEIPCEVCGSFEEAFQKAADCAGENGGGTVLLAPGCASQDMFSDYIQRGKCFVDLVHRRIQKN